MPRSFDLLSLVGRLHEGVVDEDAWSLAISNICEAIDASRLLLGRIARGGKSVELTFGHRTDPAHVAVLTGPLADPEHNPWLALAERHPLRRPATVAHLGGRDVLENAAIWQQFYLPFGIGDSVGAALERQPDHTDMLVMGRTAAQTDFAPANHAILAQILPHLARSSRVRRTLAEMQRTVGTLTHILDRLDRAIVVAGPGGEVRFANRAADRLLTQGTVIDAKRGRLCAKRHDQTRTLHSLIETAARTGIGQGAVAVDAIGLSCEDRPAALSIVAEPLSPAHGDAVGHGAEAAALLFIGDSTAATRPPPERLRIVYGLTDAEARVTSLLVDGQDVASVAGTLGVSPNTAKFHLKAVFDKVGVSRQADLVRRVLADVGGLAEPNTVQ